MSTFAPLPEALVSSTRRSVVPRGRPVFEQGSHSRFAYVVETGKVKLTQFTRNGYSNVLAILGPGDVFGELSLFDDGVRSASAYAVTPVTLRELDRQVLDELLESDREVCTWLIQRLAQRLRRANDAATDLACSDVNTHVAQVILDLADQFGEEVGDVIFLDHGLTQVELAQLAGAARESVNKALASFVARGWIASGKRTVSILDLPALVHRAGRSPRVSQPIERRWRLAQSDRDLHPEYGPTISWKSHRSG